MIECLGEDGGGDLVNNGSTRNENWNGREKIREKKREERGGRSF